MSAGAAFLEECNRVFSRFTDAVDFGSVTSDVVNDALLLLIGWHESGISLRFDAEMDAKFVDCLARLSKYALATFT